MSANSQMKKKTLIKKFRDITTLDYCKGEYTNVFIRFLIA